MASSGPVSVSRIRQFRPESWGSASSGTPRRQAVMRPEVTAPRLDPVGSATPGDRHLVGGPDVVAPYELVASAVAVAVQSMEALQASMNETADAFRWCKPAEANRRLAALAAGLRLLTTLADVAALAAGLDLSELNRRKSGAGPLDAMGSALDQLSAQQFAEDHQAMAETLGSRVSPALSGWREVFAEILVHADFRFRERPACS
jgi:hypothetical protein